MMSPPPGNSFNQLETELFLVCWLSSFDHLKSSLYIYIYIYTFVVGLRRLSKAWCSVQQGKVVAVSFAY